MSKINDEFSVNLSIEKASWACREAIESVGWNIQTLEQNRIVPKVGVGFSRNPSKIEVELNDLSAAETLIRLNGKIVGLGPLQKSHLTGEMNRLRNAIEVAARRTA